MISSPTQLPSISEMGSAESNYIQVNAQRQVAADNFRQGVIDYSFSLAGNQRASMKKSYVRLRAKLESSGGAQPGVSDKVAFAENFANNLFTSAFFYIGGVDVSSKTNFVAQSSICRQRLSSTYGWFKSSGKAYGYESSFSTRAGEIASDGHTELSFFPLGTPATSTGTVGIAGSTATFSDAQSFAIGDEFTVAGEKLIITGVTSSTVYTVVKQSDGTPPTAAAPATAFVVSEYTGVFAGISLEDGKNEIEVLFQPGALGIWETESCLPSGQYRLSLYPVNDANLTPGIECQNAATATGDFKIVVEDMYLYLHTYRAVEPVVSGHYFLDLNEMQTQVKTITSPSNNNFNLTIPPSTFGIAVFAQSKRAGVNPQLPPSIFDTEGKELLRLRNIQLTYAGKSAPSTNWDSHFSGETGPSFKNQLLQRYHDTYSNAGMSELSHETFEEFLKRGLIMYYDYVKSDDNRSTELQLSVDYNGDDFSDDVQIFVAAMYRNICRVSVEDGYVVSVTKLSI
jgi:hypothetical protein